ncbi:MAG: pyrroline-5-carboxylate reductase [Spirochaetes bacterium]|nr:MAG: pyrroline-5-carboxylate reductase [Spirochaetota bacterium]
MKRIGIIGFGVMGESLATALLKYSDRYEIGLMEKREKRVILAEEKYGLAVYSNPKAVMENSDIIIVAVKPQDLSFLLEELKESLPGNFKGSKYPFGIISIVAGRKMDVYRKYLAGRGDISNIARFMPNISARISKAPVGVSFSDKADEEFKREAIIIAEALGTPVEVSENLIPAITGLSGSGIAFVFKFVHALSVGGVYAGLPYKTALETVKLMLSGAAALLDLSKEDPAELIHEVISPSGTTIEGILSLEKGAFDYTVIDAVKSAALRAKELEA